MLVFIAFCLLKQFNINCKVNPKPNTSIESTIRFKTTIYFSVSTNLLKLSKNSAIYAYLVSTVACGLIYENKTLNALGFLMGNFNVFLSDFAIMSSLICDLYFSRSALDADK